MKSIPTYHGDSLNVISACTNIHTIFLHHRWLGIYCHSLCFEFKEKRMERADDERKQPFPFKKDTICLFLHVHFIVICTIQTEPLIWICDSAFLIIYFSYMYAGPQKKNCKVALGPREQTQTSLKIQGLSWKYQKIEKNQMKRQWLTKDPFRDSRAPSWLSEPGMYRLNSLLIGPACMNPLSCDGWSWSYVVECTTTYAISAYHH